MSQYTLDIAFGSALECIEDIFSDTSVSREETKEKLEELRDRIDIFLETLH
jgi:hypothetical protein